MIFHLNLTETLFGLINVGADFQQLLAEACLRHEPVIETTKEAVSYRLGLVAGNGQNE